ncbi:hypothetical protein [Devosia sp.]|uniref:hypothetical protein n=1 Tax=Devosia sp. TaxID=1871048 RepID=UPI003F6E7B6D
MIRRTIRIAVAGVALAALAACSSIPIGTASKLRGLDYLNDDVANLLLALDLPPSLEPVQGASTISFDITTPSSGERRIKATLIAADADDLAGTLPPPSGERNYYLFGFSDADKQAIRETQAWAKTLPAGNNALSISLSPRLCRTEPVDPAKTTISALVALPGAPGLAPLLSNQPLSSVLASAPIKDVPPCAGHSG